MVQQIYKTIIENGSLIRHWWANHKLLHEKGESAWEGFENRLEGHLLIHRTVGCKSFSLPQPLSYPLCCVFRPANGCSARRSLVEIDSLMLKRILRVFTIYRTYNTIYNNKFLPPPGLEPRSLGPVSRWLIHYAPVSHTCRKSGVIF